MTGGAGTRGTGTPGTGTRGIAIRSASRWYGEVVAVNDVTFDLGPGVTGLLGPNGAGKSTLLHMMGGLLRPSSGEVQVNGAPAWRRPALYAEVGLVLERETSFDFLTAWQYVRAAAQLQRMPDPDAATRAAIDLVDMGEAAHRSMGGYSKGMRQRARIAAALVNDPHVLLLDEPFNGTDPRQRAHLSDLLTELGRSGRVIVFSSHILEEVEHLAENVLVIIGGRLAASGDFRAIRRLMTNRPHSFTVRSSDNRALAALLVGRPDIALVAFRGAEVDVQTSDFGVFTATIAPLLAQSGIDLHELRPADASLEDVFSYLVEG